LEPLFEAQLTRPRVKLLDGLFPFLCHWVGRGRRTFSRWAFFRRLGRGWLSPFRGRRSWLIHHRPERIPFVWQEVQIRFEPLVFRVELKVIALWFLELREIESLGKLVELLDKLFGTVEQEIDTLLDPFDAGIMSQEAVAPGIPFG